MVDERILSQILYYLPQLYQLNRDLLRELEERVAHWYVVVFFFYIMIKSIILNAEKSLNESRDEMKLLWQVVYWKKML